MKKLRVILADDHTLVRAGLRSLMGQMKDVEVVAEAGNGDEVLALLPEHGPDLVLMDITMPGMNGLEATLRLKKDHPGIKVIILSMHASEEYVLQALRAGASGYLLKDAATLELALALKAVSRGETYLSPPISRQVVESYLQRVGQGGEPMSVLTERQREILQLVAEGHSTRDIARTLGLSVKTVETHRAQLMERLDIHDVAGLVRFAIRHGLVSADR
ncbi:MAG: response regulator transcription factor [Betaproteobacteria bacterium]|nr:response regulator transcription factor [Betaproteobacteria bacterium]